MFENRRHLRKHTTIYFGVYESDTDRFFGCLVNLSVDGVQLISETEIETDIIFHFRIKLPEEVNGVRDVEFDARSVWCEQSENSSFYDVGFQFDDITEDSLETIEALLEEPIFRFTEESTSVTIIKKSI